MNVETEDSAIEKIRRLRVDVLFGVDVDGNETSDARIAAMLDEILATLNVEKQEGVEYCKRNHVQTADVDQMFLCKHSDIAMQVRRLIALEDSARNLRRVS